MMKLRPLVYDPKTMIVLGGNKRLLAIQNLGLKEIPDEWVKSADELTEDEKKRFIIADNVGFGEWDWEILESDYEQDELEEWGVDIMINKEIDNLDDGEEIEIPQSVQIEPPKEYILIMAEPNSEEWEELKNMLKLKMVRRGGYKKGSAFDSVGLERVIKFKDFIERIKNVDSNTK